MHVAKVSGWIAAVAVVAGLSASPGFAETFQMNCKNSRYSYRVMFDDEAKRFQWVSDAGQADYLVIKFKTDEDGITVWGKVRRFGNDFIAYFAHDGWIKNLYANGSSMTDVCHSAH